MSNKRTGFSLMEILVAVGVFSVIAVTGLNSFVPILVQNRLSIETMRASRLAEEGLEAARSIRNRNFTTLANGTRGIGISSGILWYFVGTSDRTDKYSRRVSVSKARRDVGGSLVASGGVTDPDTFSIKSWVTWNYSIGQTRTVAVETILTNWKKGILGIEDGLMIYGNGTVTIPRIRSYNSTSNTFSAQANLPSVINPRSVIVKTSPIEREAVAGIIDNTGNLYVYCFNGGGWTMDWSASVGVTATTRPFDIEYEKNSGDVLVVYGNGSLTTNELRYRTKLGSSDCGAASWSSENTFDPVRTSNKIQWVKMAQDRRSSSNLIAVSWADNARALSAAIWSGSAMGNEPSSASETNLETGTTSASVKQSTDSFDIDYESSSGDVMLVWGNNAGTNGTNGTRYRVCTGGTSSCTWGVGGTIPGLLDDATSLDISANPTNDQIVFASIGNAGSDLQAAAWSGVGWTGRPNLDTACYNPTTAGTKLVATGWLISGGTSRSVVVYNDSNATNVGWYVGGVGATFGLQSDWAPGITFSSPQRWYDIQMDPLNSDRLMFTLSDNTRRLFAKRLVMNSTPTFTWTNADSSASLVTLSQYMASPFGFAYMQQ
ncbi:MAG: type II secretion system protein [Candidatus Shapirobacteria bacterium]